MEKKKNEVHDKAEHDMTNKENSTRKMISLDKDVSEASNRTIKSVYENGQRVVYPESTSTEEIYPKTAEPRVMFSVGDNNSEEVLPRQNKQEINSKNQRVYYPKGSDSEEKMIVQEEVKEENKDSKLSDLSKYYKYETDAEQFKLNVSYCNKCSEVFKSINAYLLKRTAGTVKLLIGYLILPKILKLIDIVFHDLLLKSGEEPNSNVLMAHNFISALGMAFLCFVLAITAVRIVHLCFDFLYLRIPVMRNLLQHSSLVSEEARRLL